MQSSSAPPVILTNDMNCTEATAARTYLILQDVRPALLIVARNQPQCRRWIGVRMPQAQARRTAGPAELLDIDLGESYMVGDRRDTEAGQRAAARIILGS
jgi:hypothetical protein